ncbi:MAG: ABC transporter ATP-binding protein [Phycisphaeraceae bacterium]|nr:ABC transporter ATP-binding protein [Phycisphaeraceae bacterium]
MLPIQLRNLSKQFGSTVALDQVSLDIAAGELFFLLGPSGCGKTTLLRLLAGFIPPSAGTVHFGDRDVTSLPVNQRQTAMVFQGYALWPHMTVRQNVAFGLTVRKVPAAEQERRLQEVLEAVNLRAWAERKPNELSGGQQQRVALARALVVEPQLLLLDEPLANLDAQLRAQLREEIRDLCRRRRITAVYVTHDQQEALAVADRIAVMKDGRLVQVGPPRDLYRRPADAFVAGFLGAANFVPATVQAVENGLLRLQSPLGTLRAGVFPPALAPGQSVVCCIRPESLHLRDAAAEPAPTTNCLALRCVAQLYFGATCEHRLVPAAAGDPTFSLRWLEIRPTLSTRAGAAVELGLAPHDVVVFSPAPPTTPAPA